jgi:protein TonB
MSTQALNVAWQVRPEMTLNLTRALLFSVLAHLCFVGALSWWALQPADTPLVPPRLVTRLQPAPSPVRSPQVTPTPSARQPPAVATPKTAGAVSPSVTPVTPVLQMPSEVPRSVEVARPVIATPEPPRVSVTESSKATETTKLVEPARSTVSAAPSTPTTGPSAPQSDALDAGAVARYRLELMSNARRFKRYPRLALDNNWEGRVELRVSFSMEGKRLGISVLKSSGHSVLDQQAVDMLGRTNVPLPDTLRGRAFTLDIPVIYNLREETGG